MKKVCLSLVVGLGLLAGCTPAHRLSAVPGPALKLAAFASCADLLDGLRTAAKKVVGPYGLRSTGILTFDQGKSMAAVPGPEAAAPDHSGTNDHEAAADEPDLVKTDGKRI